VLVLIQQGRSYRLVGREVGLSKNTVADIVKRNRILVADRNHPEHQREQFKGT
jgi:putative DNA-invertase from lambdoid prophage Rac